MSETQELITIAIVMLGTAFTRFFPFFIFPEGKEPPAFITYLGRVLPYAVMGFLIIYCLKDVSFQKNFALPEAIAIFTVVVLQKWKKNSLISIAGGTVLYMFLVQVCFV